MPRRRPRKFTNKSERQLEHRRDRARRRAAAAKAARDPSVALPSRSRFWEAYDHWNWD